MADNFLQKQQKQPEGRHGELTTVAPRPARHRSSILG
jgi:hypothetical protein